MNMKALRWTAISFCAVILQGNKISEKTCNRPLSCQDNDGQWATELSPVSQDSHRGREGRIVNGDEASGPVPWQVGLMIQDEDICGGTIISCKWILTAAHCVNDDVINFDRKAPYWIHVVAGSTLQPNKSLKHPADAQVARIHVTNENRFVHPNFTNDLENEGNDIAVLSVDCPFQFNEKVRPAALPSTVLPVKEAILISGWGTEDFVGIPSEILRVARVNKSICSNFELLADESAIERGLIFCAYGAKDGTAVDACYGDSGGPAATLIGNSKYVTVSGITSYGLIQCGLSDVAGRYVNVHSYLSWITATTGVSAPATTTTTPEGNEILMPKCDESCRGACKGDLRRGVTPELCEPCKKGQTWWPCNDNTLCTCVASSAPDRKRLRAAHRGTKKIQPHGDMI